MQSVHRDEDGAGENHKTESDGEPPRVVHVEFQKETLREEDASPEALRSHSPDEEADLLVIEAELSSGEAERYRTAILQDLERQAREEEQTLKVWEESERLRKTAAAEADLVRSEAAAEAGRLRSEAGRIQDEAEQLIAQARAEAERLRRRGQAEATRIKKEALSEAEGLRANAETEAQQLKAKAEAEAERLRTDAETERTALIHRARAQVQQAALAAGERIRAAAESNKGRLFEEACREAASIRSAAQAEALQVVNKARKEHSRILEHAAQEAGRISQSASEELELGRAAAEREAEDIIEGARQIAAEQCDRIRDRLMADIESERDRAIMEAQLQARADAEPLKAQIIDQAREQARFEASRLRNEAIAEGEKAASQILDAARLETRGSQASLLRAEEVIRANADNDLVLLRAGEIAERDFPLVRRGFDPEAVHKWLEVVQLSHAVLEDELDRARGEWLKAIQALSATKTWVEAIRSRDRDILAPGADDDLRRTTEQWERALEILARSRSRASGSNFKNLLVQGTALKDRLKRQVFGGYAPAQVEQLLESLSAQIARAESQVSSLRSENEDLRARLLSQPAEPLPPSLIELPAPGQSELR